MGLSRPPDEEVGSQRTSDGEPSGFGRSGYCGGVVARRRASAPAIGWPLRGSAASAIFQPTLRCLSLWRFVRGRPSDVGRCGGSRRPGDAGELLALASALDGSGAVAWAILSPSSCKVSVDRYI